MAGGQRPVRLKALHSTCHTASQAALSGVGCPRRASTEDRRPSSGSPAVTPKLSPRSGPGRAVAPGDPPQVSGWGQDVASAPLAVGSQQPGGLASESHARPPRTSVGEGGHVYVRQCPKIWLHGGVWHFLLSLTARRSSGPQWAWAGGRGSAPQGPGEGPGVETSGLGVGSGARACWAARRPCPAVGTGAGQRAGPSRESAAGPRAGSSLRASGRLGRGWAVVTRCKTEGRGQVCVQPGRGRPRPAHPVLSPAAPASLTLAPQLTSPLGGPVEERGHRLGRRRGDP